ncbi:MAG: nitrous oxide-stimulated promoter family protein [Limisphaerales bacterium]
MRTVDEVAGFETTAAPVFEEPPVPGAVGFSSRRLAREWKTMAAMVGCYCRDHHGVPSGLCGECRELLDYATVRLERCRFGEEKPTCANCPVHCYQRSRRDQMKVVMRHAGPRMLWQHPILALFHWLDGGRKAPAC